MTFWMMVVVLAVCGTSFGVVQVSSTDDGGMAIQPVPVVDGSSVAPRKVGLGGYNQWQFLGQALVVFVGGSVMGLAIMIHRNSPVPLRSLLCSSGIMFGFVVGVTIALFNYEFLSRVSLIYCIALVSSFAIPITLASIHNKHRRIDAEVLRAEILKYQRENSDHTLSDLLGHVRSVTYTLADPAKRRNGRMKYQLNAYAVLSLVRELEKQEKKCSPCEITRLYDLVMSKFPPEECCRFTVSTPKGKYPYLVLFSSESEMELGVRELVPGELRVICPDSDVPFELKIAGSDDQPKYSGREPIPGIDTPLA